MQDYTNARSITATKPYSVRELAKALKCGRAHLYKQIDQGSLRAMRLNDRGEYRVMGSWALDWMERAAIENKTASEVSV